jgi:hypothetical protein
VSAKLLLVDFENVQEFDLSCLDEDFRIIVFVGASQKGVSIELVKRLQGLGNRVDWQKVQGNGNNAGGSTVFWSLTQELPQRWGLITRAWLKSLANQKKNQDHGNAKPSRASSHRFFRTRSIQ